MSEAEARQGRIVLIGVGLVSLAVLALMGFVIVGSGETEEVAESPAPSAPTPRTEPVRAAPRSVRVPLPAPSGRRHPDVRQRKEPVHLDGDLKLVMNTAVDDAIRPARVECLEPWVDGLPNPHETEFVFDAVIHDGELADIGLRSLSVPVPEEVVGCVADKVWEADWPTMNVPGELRLQRTLTVTPAPP
ncbi:MAG: hypothetical protein KC621_30040 [Myxococcales bacterium]|nr:hypothetical protein [Myxococcales bacterium]